jgi:hypothetical protein
VTVAGRPLIVSCRDRSRFRHSKIKECPSVGDRRAPARNATSLDASTLAHPVVRIANTLVHVVIIVPVQCNATEPHATCTSRLCSGSGWNICDDREHLKIVTSQTFVECRQMSQMGRLRSITWGSSRPDTGNRNRNGLPVRAFCVASFARCRTRLGDVTFLPHGSK